jgi:hypothetical protein
MQHRWVDLGLPSAVTMRVRAYRAGQAPPLGTDEVLMRRARTDFIWSLREGNRQVLGPDLVE